MRRPLVEIPFIATNRCAASDPVGEFPTKLLGPAADSFIADDDPCAAGISSAIRGLGGNRKYGQTASTVASAGKRRRR
jgi:hypothetical protein